MDRIRTNVVLPRDLIEAIDRRVGKRKRSDFLAEAAREKLARTDFLRVAKALAGSLNPAEYPEFSSAEGVETFVLSLREVSDIRYRGKESPDE